MGDRSFPRATLATERLALRPFERADAPDVHEAWQDEAYLRYAPVGLSSAGADLQWTIDWCAAADDRRRAGTGVSFAVVPREDTRLVGCVSLGGVDWAAMTTEIHYWVAPWGRGNRYGAEAAREAASWALIDRGFARVTLQAVTDNVASVRVAEAAGFRFEGVLRDAAFTHAGRGDMAVYGLIPRDLEP
jgi:RimJ/RimL family protein N-acetyltransferase